MDGQHSRRALPNTPRVNDRIMEYYQRFGQDRDLEKFMRIYSPSASSQDSQSASQSSNNRHGSGACCLRSNISSETISSSGSRDALMKIPTSHPLSRDCCLLNSKSMPNIDLQGTTAAAKFGGKDIIMDINIEMEGGEAKFLSASTECIHTPKKDPLCDIKQTKTPESVAKTHRRLEWDSLGDIGYKKSMSTSNVSVLERSLLKDFFKENSGRNSEHSSSTHENSDKQQTQLKEQQHKTLQVLKTTCAEQSTPPLASSTMVDINSNKAIQRGARPKMISQSTSMTSLQKKFEKYAQTSLIKPANTHSQEIQVSMSSATPSSFEYRSSRSSRSSKSSEFTTNSDFSNKPIHKKATHPFINSITELLAKRRQLGENNQVPQCQEITKINRLQSKFQSALEENKENHRESTLSSTSTSFSLTRHAPELDLGIQLICSLIDAKSVTGRQKKKLIRDIVKRITRLNDEGKLTIDSAGKYSTNSEKQNVYDSVYQSGRNALDKSCQVLLNLPCDLGVTPMNSEGLQIQENVKGKNHARSLQKPTTNDKHATKKVMGNNENSISNKKISHHQTVAATHNANHIEALNLTDINKSSPRRRNKDLTSELNRMKNKSSTNTFHDPPYNAKLKTRSTQTSKTSLSSESKKSHTTLTSSSKSSGAITSTSTGSSHDLPTQKSLRRPSNVLNDQSTMREWLNPLTQSEIEYEEKKREEIERKHMEEIKQLKKEKHTKKSKQEGELKQQLSWIETEIQRLEGLKHLLLKDNSTEKPTNTTTTTTTTTTTSTCKENEEASHQKEENSKNSTHTDKLYDTVYSDKSSVLSESAERLVEEIEYILEESNEDIINFKDNSKKSKERKKETQIVYEKAKPHEKFPKEKYRSVKETITTINEGNLAASTFPPTTQRKKIATPETSDQSQEGTESLRDLVKQKKHDFMELYKTKKQNHYDALKQQQKVQANYKYDIPGVHKGNGTKPTAFKYSGHYSVPHTINRQFSPTEYAYPQSRLPPTPEEHNDPNTKTSSDIIYSTAAAHMQRNRMQQPQSVVSTTTTASSASIFCVSSDVSVPMGSNNASSTPTTTHHYDDVAAAVAGVAVQTSDSMLRLPANAGAQLRPYFYVQRQESVQRFSQPIITNTAAIQVKPRGIAYVIEFEDEETTDSAENNVGEILNKKPLAESSVVSAMLKPSSKPSLTLQDHLEKAKPKFLQQTKERKAILNKLQAMRQARVSQLREIIDNTSFNSLERRLHNLPPPPTQKIRILNTKEMKALTNKRCASLPEVVARKQREVEERNRRGNRVLRDVFNRRLQKRVRSGKLSLNHSKTVI